MQLKKRIAAGAAVVVMSAVLCAAALLNVKKAYEAPKKLLNETAPTVVYTTRTEYYTDEPTAAPTVTQPPETTENAQKQPPAEQTVQTGDEPATVSATMPRPDYFDIPLGLEISMDYSRAEAVFSPTMGDWRTHNGVDFSGVVGDPVKSCAAGFITDVYDDPMFGTVVEVDHGGGITAKYCGLGKGSNMPVGTEVKMDDTIGYLGTVPCEAEDGAHLHFEMRENGELIDPLTLLNNATVN